MKLKVESLANALQGIESNHQLDPAIVEDALKEALTKAYQKQMKAHSKQTELRDVQVKVEIVNGIVHIYQVREVMNDDDITDDELEISLEEAKAIRPRRKSAIPSTRKSTLRNSTAPRFCWRKTS